MGCIQSKSSQNNETPTTEEDVVSIEQSGSSLGLRPKGVSVHWLNTGFLKEVEDYGKLPSSKIYEIENLHDETNGLIRQKGQDVICPRDGRVGAAYVDCLRGEDHVGPANIMLSYGWGNQIGDVAHTLLDHCQANDLDPKRSYVWICCLCNNQHRVAEDIRLGKEVPFPEFEAIFRDKVLGIGNIVALMAPWNDPIYLTRVWCIFELFTSHRHNCNLTISMPPREKLSMIQTLNTAEGISFLFDVFASTAVENAQASEESDKTRILSMVRDSIGFEELNNEVNILLREWVKKSILQAVDELSSQYEERTEGDPEKDANRIAEIGHLCNQVGHALDVNGEHEEALRVLLTSLEMTRTAFGDDHLNCATPCGNIGLALMNMGQYENALAYFRKTLNIQQLSTEPSETTDMAKTVMSIGAACFQLDKYNDAMECYQWSLNLFVNELGENHSEVASNYDNLGSVFKVLNKMDDAAVSYQKAINIREELLGTMHPDTALSYNNYASLLSDQGRQADALVYFEKTLEVEKKVLGNDHYNTAITYHNIGLAYDRNKEFERALEFYQKGLEIKMKVLKSENHPSVGTSYLGLGTVMKSLGRHDESLKYYEKAISIHKNTVKEENSSAAILYNNMACLLADMTRYGESLEYFERAYSIWVVSLGVDHDQCKNVLQSMRVVKAYTEESPVS